MDQTTTTNLTLTEAESQVMRSILTPLRPIMMEATLSQTWTEDNPARVRDGWTVALDGGLCSPNGKIWHPRHFGDRYAISTVDEDGVTNFSLLFLYRYECPAPGRSSLYDLYWDKF